MSKPNTANRPPTLPPASSWSRGRRLSKSTTADRVALGNVRYDLVGKLVEETGLTRATIAAILQGTDFSADCAGGITKTRTDLFALRVKGKAGQRINITAPFCS